MASYPRSTAAYIFLLILLALGAVLFSVVRIDFDVSSWAIVLILAIVIALFDIKPVALFGYSVEVTLSVAVKFAAVLLFPPSIVILGTFVGTFWGELSAKRKWLPRLFNSAEMTLSIFVCSFIFQTLYQPQGGYFGSIQNAAAVILSCIGHYLINSVLVCLVISLNSKTSVLAVWRQSIRPVVWYDLSLYPFGIIFAILWQYSPLSVILTVVIFLIIRRSYQVSVQLQRQTQDALRALVRVIDERDHHTFDHSERVSKYAEAIAKALDLPQEEIDIIGPAALLHDLGKVGMVDDILFGDKPLNPDEIQHARRHAEVGATLLSKFPLFDKGTLLVRHHHERYDGKGYPDGLKGDAIPRGARIISVADSYQAMTEDRTYRRALSREEAIAQLVKGSGTQFDPQVVETFIRILRANHLGL